MIELEMQSIDNPVASKRLCSEFKDLLSSRLDNLFQNIFCRGPLCK
jgi:hypothetical protein